MHTNTELHISGMSCPSCAQNVKRALEAAGARAVDVDWPSGRVSVETDGAPAADLARALEGTRYRVERIVAANVRASGDGGAHAYDLAIIGSGGGAFAAAIAARREDLRVVMIERGTVGGTCVNIGCIPSKALLAAADARRRAAEQRFPGIVTDAGPVDLGALIAGKREIVEGLRKHKYVDLAAEYGIELVNAGARFVEGPALEVDGRRIEWRRAPSRASPTSPGWSTAAI
jgi:mercuric reductase